MRQNRAKWSPCRLREEQQPRADGHADDDADDAEEELRGVNVDTERTLARD